MNAIIYSTKHKRFSVVSEDLAKTMLFMGNPHGYNRAHVIPPSGVSGMVEVMEANGYKLERGEA